MVADHFGVAVVIDCLTLSQTRMAVCGGGEEKEPRRRGGHIICLNTTEQRPAFAGGVLM